MSAAGRELRTVLDLVAPALRHSAAGLWRPDGLRERYQRYLVAMHAVVRASVPLMELAVATCERTRSTDPVARGIADRLPWHIAQELHHDDWLLGDMAAAGLLPAQESSRQPSRAVARLVGAQYYWIGHHHPVCLLGYIAALEGGAPAPRLGDLLAARCGLPPEAFRTLRHHAQADPGHTAAVLDLLDGLDLAPEQHRAVRVSALHTVQALIEVFDSLTATAGRDRI